MIHVFDADSLWHLMNMKKIENIDFADSHFVFTPNKNEFIRLFERFFIQIEDNNADSFDKEFDYDQEQLDFFDYLLNENKSIYYLKAKVNLIFRLKPD